MHEHINKYAKMQKKQRNLHKVPQSMHSNHKKKQSMLSHKVESYSCYKAHTRLTREAPTCKAKQRRERRAASKPTSQRCTPTHGCIQTNHKGERYNQTNKKAPKTNKHKPTNGNKTLKHDKDARNKI